MKYHLAKMKKSKKGISPVVATVILVAVAVVIAAALAGFAGSLFGSYSQGPQVKVQKMAMANDGTGVLTMSNAGNTADSIKSVSISNVGIASFAADATSIKCTCVAADNVVSANTNSQDYDITLDTAGFTAPDAGTQVTAVVLMQSGAQITQTLTLT